MNFVKVLMVVVIVVLVAWCVIQPFYEQRDFVVSSAGKVLSIEYIKSAFGDTRAKTCVKTTTGTFMVKGFVSCSDEDVVKLQKAKRMAYLLFDKSATKRAKILHR